MKAQNWKAVRAGAVADGQINEERVAELKGTALAQVRAHRLAEVRSAAGLNPLESSDTGGMTDVPQPPDGVGPDQPKAKRPFIIPFHADIQVASPMRVVDGGVELLIEDRRVVVPVTEEQRLKLQQQPPEPDQPQRVSLWFRTTEGRVQNLECFNFSLLRGERARSALPNKPQFSIGASFKQVNREEGCIVVEVKPNSTGNLLESFELQIWAAPDFLNRRFYTDQTYLIYGQYDPLSEHLIATEIKVMKIGVPMLPRTVKPVKQITSFAELMKIKRQKNRRQKKEQAKALAAAAKATESSEDQSTVTSPDS